MTKEGILVVSYGAREAAMVDAFMHSRHDVEFYIADKQRNPFNVARAAKHVVIPDLNVRSIAEFAKEYRSRISFGIVGSEGPIISGIRDVIEAETGIPMICPTKEYAIEGSKVAQRELIAKVSPEANPRYKVFDPAEKKSKATLKDELHRWLDELKDEVAVKPDKPGFGKGVGVYGDHLFDRDGVWEHFSSLYDGGAVIVEEKIEGEEFSLQCFSDGSTLFPTPAVRDYKRAFDGDKGPNTGGMGSYKSSGWRLPFMTDEDLHAAVRIAYRLFERLKGKRYNPDIRGMPMYIGFVCAKDGVKIFEINSRPGDPEIINLLPIMKDDLVDFCRGLIRGDVQAPSFEQLATVGIYLVPEPYPDKDKKERKIDLTEFDALSRRYSGKLLGYPAAMEVRDDENYALSSRTFYSLGIGESEEAWRIAMEGVHTVKGNGFRHRNEIGAQEYIRRSVEHMKELRGLE